MRVCTPSRSIRGFTLIEILIVVALLSIAATMLIPNMRHMTDFETEAAVRQIVADLTFAQSDATAHQASRRVLFEEDGSGYRLLGDPFDYDNDVLWDPIGSDGQNKYIVDFKADPRFKSVVIDSAVFDSDSSFITFDSIGGPVDDGDNPSTGGLITIKGADGIFEIQMAAFTGRISVNRIEAE